MAAMRRERCSCAVNRNVGEESASDEHRGQTNKDERGQGGGGKADLAHQKARAAPMVRAGLIAPPVNGPWLEGASVSETEELSFDQGSEALLRRDCKLF